MLTMKVADYDNSHEVSGWVSVAARTRGKTELALDCQKRFPNDGTPLIQNRRNFSYCVAVISCCMVIVIVGTFIILSAFFFLVTWLRFS